MSIPSCRYYDEANTTYSFQKYQNVEFGMLFQTDFVFAAKIRHSLATSVDVTWGHRHLFHASVSRLRHQQIAVL